jgi:hypothetical protein
MTEWQYAQLRVTYDDRSVAGDDRWTVAWHGLDLPTHKAAYDGVIAELNRAGSQGWELVDVADLGAGDSGRSPGQGDWSLTRYTLRRPYGGAVVKSAERSQQAESARSQPIGTSGPTVQDGLLAGPGLGKSATFRITVYRLRDGKRAGSTTQDRGVGSDAGGLLIQYQATRLPSQADIDTIESFRAGYQAHGISKEREKIKDATAEYAASWTEGQLGTTCWEIPQSFPTLRAAELLNSSAEWLQGLVERPAAGAASAASVPGPLVPVGAGITAYSVTGPVAALFGDAARVCEVAGMVIGLATGNIPLFIASAKLFLHDELGDVLARGFEDIISSPDVNIDPTGKQPPTVQPGEAEPEAPMPQPEDASPPVPPPGQRIPQRFGIPWKEWERLTSSHGTNSGPTVQPREANETEAAMPEPEDAPPPVTAPDPPLSIEERDRKFQAELERKRKVGRLTIGADYQIPATGEPDTGPEEPGTGGPGHLL